MNNRLRLLLIALGGLIVLAIYTYPLWQGRLNMGAAAVGDIPAWVSDPLRATFLALNDEQKSAYNQLAVENIDQARRLLQAAGQPDTIVPEAEQAMPEMIDPVQIASNSFTKIDVVREATGTAILFQLPDNRRVLRFEDFRSTKGVNLHVLMVRSEEPRTPQDVGSDYIDLGPLRGNIGNQNYDIPVEVDLAAYPSVVIYDMQLQLVVSSVSLK